MMHLFYTKTVFKLCFMLVCLLGGLRLLASPVAQIGETQYETLADAFIAAQNGDTVELIDDVVLSEMIALEANSIKSITLNLGNYKISSENTRLKYSYNESTHATTIPSFNDVWGASLIRLYGGYELTINGGVLTNFSATVVANREKKLSPKVTLNNVVVQDSFFSAHNYEAQLNINDAIVSNTQFFVRSTDNTSGYIWAPELNVNGGEFVDTDFMVSPYSYTCQDEISIIKGVFKKTRFLSRNGSARLKVGEIDATGLSFDGCNFFALLDYSNQNYSPSIVLNAGVYNLCTNKVVLSGSNPSYGKGVITVNGGSYNDFSLRSAASSSSYNPKTTINGGHFNGSLIYAYEGAQASESLLTVTGGTYDYCVFLSRGATPDLFLNGGTLNGCCIGAVAYMGYPGHRPSVSNRVSTVTANSCYIYSKNDEITTGSSGYPKSIVSLAQGTFIGCTTEQFKGSGSNILKTPTISNACKMGEEGVVNAITALSLLQTQDSVEFELLHDCYTPVLNVNVTDIQFNNIIPIAIESGKTATISSQNSSMIDSYFSVAGRLNLKGVVYTGLIDVQEGGLVYVGPGTRLKQDPVASGFKFIGSCKVTQDPGTLEYVVSKRPGFVIVVH